TLRLSPMNTLRSLESSLKTSEDGRASASTVRPSGAFSAKRQAFPWKLQTVDGTEHRRRQGVIGEQIVRNALEVLARHTLDAFERFIQAKLTVEVNFLPGQMRHATGGALQVQHEATLQVILR